MCDVQVSYLNVHVSPYLFALRRIKPERHDRVHILLGDRHRRSFDGGDWRRDDGCHHGRVEPSERRLERAFFEREVTVVAKDLLGRVIVSGDGADRVAVRLTEVEAYRGRDDSASHAFRGPTPRTAVMFGPGRPSLYLFRVRHALVRQHRHRFGRQRVGRAAPGRRGGRRPGRRQRPAAEGRGRQVVGPRSGRIGDRARPGRVRQRRGSLPAGQHDPAARRLTGRRTPRSGPARGSASRPRPTCSCGSGSRTIRRCRRSGRGRRAADRPGIAGRTSRG